MINDAVEVMHTHTKSIQFDTQFCLCPSCFFPVTAQVVSGFDPLVGGYRMEATTKLRYGTSM